MCMQSSVRDAPSQKPDMSPDVNKIVIEIAAPPAATVICWLVSRVLAALQGRKVKPVAWIQFWLLLISGYVLFALALWRSGFLTSHERDDPSPELAQ